MLPDLRDTQVLKDKSSYLCADLVLYIPRKFYCAYVWLFLIHVFDVRTNENP